MADTLAVPRHPAAEFQETRVADERVADEIDRLFRGVRYFPSGLYFRQQSHRQFLRKLPRRAPAGGRLLDLGCGPAARYRPYVEAAGFAWHGADVMDADVGGHQYRKVEANHVAWDDGFFDAVAAFNVIEHFTHPEAMFAEIRRLLRKGGLFFGACAFWEMEHGSYFHLTHRGLAALLERHDFDLLSLQPSEYTGAILSAQRYLGGSGTLRGESPIAAARSVVQGLANWVPFLIANAQELIRRTVVWAPEARLKDCATFYFYAMRR